MFDGGAADKTGVGGFVITNKTGKVLSAQGRYYGSELPTNNGAEC
jgi:hypothetical protein